MTLVEAARILSVTPANLRQSAIRGALRATKHGPLWWVTPSEVERYARENRQRNPATGSRCSSRSGR